MKTMTCMPDETRHAGAPTRFEEPLDQRFDNEEEHWFSTATRRPSERPTLPAPPSFDDSIADGWFYDV
jgi:hypothetical protein